MRSGPNWLYTAMALAGGFLGGIAALEVAPGVAAAARRTHVMRAERFELTAPNGSKRAVLEVTPRGMADLVMFDGKGRDRAEFRVANDGGASIGFYGENGERRVLVGESPSSRNGIAIYSNNGRQMLAALTVAQDNQASLTLYDPNTGRARAGLGTAANGSPALVLFDQNGKDRAELHVTATGKPGLALANADGKTVAGLPEKAVAQEARQPQQ